MPLRPVFVRALVFSALVVALPAQALLLNDDLAADNGDRDYRPGLTLPTSAQKNLVAALKAKANWNRFGTIHTLIRHGAYLGSGYGGTPAEGARAWILDNRELFRLSPASVAELEVVNAAEMPWTDARAVLFRQRFGSLKPTTEGLITVGIVNGKIYYASSSSAGDQPPAGAARITALEAWTRAAADLNRYVSAQDLLRHSDATAQTGWHLLQVLGFSEVQRARLIAAPMPQGGVRQAWETIVLDNQYGLPLAFMHWIDAETGAVLRRQNHVNHQAGGVPTAMPYQGSLSGAEGECAARHSFSVAAGNASVQVALATAVPTNAASLALYFGEGDTAVKVAEASPRIGGIESLTYAPTGGVPAGSYQVETCLGDAFINLPPFNYVGVFAALPVDASLSSPLTGADHNAPRWRWFPGTPLLDYSSNDTRLNACFAPLPGGSAFGGCDVDAGNVAARAPWDVLLGTVPTFTTIGNAAITAGGSLSPLTPSLPILPVSPTRKYEFAFNNAWHESGCDPAGIVASQVPGANGNDLSAITVNLFVAHNRMHDFAYHLGFTERNYNLQLSNFGLTPVTQQNDPELGTAQAGALIGHPVSPTFGTVPGRNNANQVTLPDGVPGITNQYLFQPIGGVGYPPCADGSWDMGIVGHEYTHAISNRMAGGPDGNLSGDQAGAMGEAWGDLTANEYMHAYNVVSADADGNRPVATANYTTGLVDSGIRNYSMAKNPLNYSNIGYDTPGVQVHADGEIWMGTQWSLRQALVEKWESQFPAGDVARQRDCADGKISPEACPGNRRWIQLVFDAWLLMPSAVSMLDARDAMLAADLARFGGANQADMWRVFASRGMGEFAYSASTDDPTPMPSFESPMHDDEAEIRFEAAASDGAKTPIVGARLLVGQHSTRTRHVADTDPETIYDAGFPIDTLNAPVNLDIARLLPGTYDFIVTAPGYGIHRFPGIEVKSGASTLRFTLPTNWASSRNGASGVGQATGVESPLASVNPFSPSTDVSLMLDDSEDTGALIGDDGNVAGSHVTVALGGGAQEISHMAISVAAGPLYPGRWGALRQFEVRVCNGGCSDPEGDFGTVVYTSAPDFFPGGNFRPKQWEMNLRSFSFEPVTATHVQVRTLSTQCYGNARYLGDSDSDPINDTNCPTARGLITGLEAVSGGLIVNPDPGSYARATEIQVFTGPASRSGGASSARAENPGRFGGALPLLTLAFLFLVRANRVRN